MCRYAAYLGEPKLLSELIYAPKNSLVHQASNAVRSLTRINADGFGVAWYSPDVHPEPAVFKDTSPLWNNYNLGSIADKILSPCILAHVRAAKRFDPVTRENCHPFQRGRLLWMHNGDIPGRARLQRQVALVADDTLLAQIRGNTDSEMAFTLFLTRLTVPPSGEVEAGDLADAMSATIAELVSWHLESGDPRPLEMNFCVTDGRSLVACRFGLGDRPAQSLSWRHYEHGARRTAVCIASEPLSPEAPWETAENGDLIVVSPGLEMDRRRLPLPPRAAALAST